MYRNVTAIYRDHATADLVRRELEELGIARRHIHVVPDRNEGLGVGELREDHDKSHGDMDALRDLDLPDDDLRTYQHSVRNGDFVVSVEVDDDNPERVHAIMRRPEEGWKHSEREEMYRDQPAFDRTGTLTEPDVGRRARRDTANDDPYLRGYERDEPLGGRDDPLGERDAPLSGRDDPLGERDAPLGDRDRS